MTRDKPFPLVSGFPDGKAPKGWDSYLRGEVILMFKRLRERLGLGGSAVDHALTKDELLELQGDHMRLSNGATNPGWYSSRRDSFVEGRPRR